VLQWKERTLKPQGKARKEIWGPGQEHPGHGETVLLHRKSKKREKTKKIKERTEKRRLNLLALIQKAQGLPVSACRDTT